MTHRNRLEIKKAARRSCRACKKKLTSLPREVTLTRHVDKLLRAEIIRLLEEQADSNQAQGLGRTANSTEVMRRLRESGHVVGLQPILNAARECGIKPRTGRPKGLKLPGVGGRPRGSLSSSRRTRVLELSNQAAPELTLRDIAQIMSEEGNKISPEGARKLLLSDEATEIKRK